MVPEKKIASDHSDSGLVLVILLFQPHHHCQQFNHKTELSIMADDGMLLNFELGAEPLKAQVKFTGGRWRDRKRAERSAKLAHTGPASKAGEEDDAFRSSK